MQLGKPNDAKKQDAVSYGKQSFQGEGITGRSCAKIDEATEQDITILVGQALARVPCNMSRTTPDIAHY